MKIVIADGGHAADYVIKTFKKRGNKLIIINSNKDLVQYLTKSNRVPVFYGDPSKTNVLSDAHIEGSDIFVALGDRDADNFVSCLLAKQIFGVKKCICIVSNPKNVETYRELGIDSVISSTYLLATSIESESSLEKLTKSMRFEDDKVVLTEIIVKDNYLLANKQIMDINFPKCGTISCVYRKPNVIIPNGKTVILPNDCLFTVSAVKDQKLIIDYAQREKENKEENNSL